MKVARSSPPSLSLRRAVRASILGGLAFMMLGGVLGLAVAHEEGGGGPQNLVEQYRDLQLPSMRAGDVVVYDRSWGAENGAHSDILQWAEPAVVADHLGAQRLVNLLRVERHGVAFEDRGGVQVPIPSRSDLLFEAGTNEFVAFRQDHNSSHAANDVGWSASTKSSAISTTFVNQSFLRYDDHGNLDALILYQFDAIACGILNPLQREPLGDAGVVSLFADCREHLNTADWPAKWRENHTFRLVAKGHHEGKTVLRFDLEYFALPEGRAPPNATVWIDPTVPYPIAMEWKPAIGTSGRYVLREYRAGGSPLPAQPWETGTVPSLEVRPAKPWGPDDEGVLHPFPLSHAYRVALDDPTDDSLRTFVQSHSGARTVMAEYHQTVDHWGTHRIWALHISDGEEELRLCAVRIEPPGAGQQAPYEGISRDPSHSCPTERHPGRPITCMPEEFPTVASLAERWVRHHGTDPWNGWGFRLSCGAPAPLDVAYRIGQRNLHSDVRPDGGAALRFRGDYAQHVLTLGSDFDSMWTSESSAQTSSSLGQISGDGGRSSPSGGTILPQAADMVPVSLWELPAAAQVAGAGFAAALIAAAYWAWPSLKQLLALPLYSRLERPKALELPTRSRIQAAVEAQPGIHFQALARVAELAPSTLEFHLKKLEQLGLVKSHLGHGYRSVFPAATADRRLMTAAGALKSAGARQVLAALLAQPEAPVAELAQRARLTRQTAHEHLARLADAKLVEVRREGRRVKYRATPSASLVLSSLSSGPA
ncbi:MAG: helix-turn-helix domain-containing protein [Euryarchaeota archaeon]|nr:helix-turn-helix domain-containing protein [Euryarchaeota archaeon]